MKKELKTFEYGMTLRELLRSCDFDDIAKEVSNDETQAGCERAYMLAYHILVDMEPYAGETRDVFVTLYEGEDTPEGPMLSAGNVEGVDWQEYIDGKIHLVEDIRNMQFTKEHLAYRILWHLTFYGFCPEEQRETFAMSNRDSGHDTEYGRKAGKIELKRNMLLANDRIRKAILDSYEWNRQYDMETYSLPEKDWNYIYNHRRHCNRMKRMRDYRLKMQAKKLWELDDEIFYGKLRKKYAHILDNNKYKKDGTE